MALSTIKSEGSLISADLLVRIVSGEATGQRTVDFGLDGKTRLIDEIAACWSEAKAYWDAFQHAQRRIKEEESGATITREQWVLPLLRSLGYDKVIFTKKASEVGGRTYAISHRLGDDENGLPIHIEGARFAIDHRPPTGRPRISPHALLQEYLNRTDHLWGIVTNGYLLRVLRDSSRLSRPIYLEFDLKEMMETENFADFQVFYRIVHRTRFPKSKETASECLLEQYYQDGIESGGRVRERLRDGVEEAIKIFGNGFLAHSGNAELKDRIKSGSLSATAYYRQILRLIYRFLFLMVSEERKLVGPDSANDALYKVYIRHYSILRLREVVERPLNPDERHYDTWEGVKQTFALYCYSEPAKKLEVAMLNGDLFGPRAIPDLEGAYLSNVDFLRGFARLSLFREDKITRRINYAHLDVEELGSVYESLLDYYPTFKTDDDKLSFALLSGTERKSTGSYYTRPELVQELIKSALVPVIEERLRSAQTKADKEKALLSLKVCDISSGSGHFLLAAARRIGMELAKVRSGEEQPTPTEYKQAVRDVIQHCIYGVDINPLAVDLCKVALWLEGHNKGRPLTFLDHRIRCGNSLVGIDTLDRLKSGIPDEAFKPVTGDDKEVAKKIKAQNKKERKASEEGQKGLSLDFGGQLNTDLHDFAKRVAAIDQIEELDSSDVNRKQAEYERIRSDANWMIDWTAANIWTSAFFYQLTSEHDPAVPTHGRLTEYIDKPKTAHGQLVGKANALAMKHNFFHWSLEFPDVAEVGGFDVVLGNPPWEVSQLREEEYFSVRDANIANLVGDDRKIKIQKLETENPQLFKEFQYDKSIYEKHNEFIRQNGRYALTARGKINFYPLFTEHALNIINKKGRVGIIVPSGIATDDSTKEFFGHIFSSGQIVSLYEFENVGFFNVGQGHMVRFALTTLSGSKIEARADFFFQGESLEQLNDVRRHFALTNDDVLLLNPNTSNCPIFQTDTDAELNKKIYKIAGVFINEKAGEPGNPWNIVFRQGLFNMASDSNYFKTLPQLQAEGGVRKDSIVDVHGVEYVRLYEAKMVNLWNHRHGDFSLTQEEIRSHKLPEVPLEKLLNNQYEVQSYYWVPRDEVDARLKAKHWNNNWLIGWRDVTDSRASARTLIAAIIPKVGTGDTFLLMLPSSSSSVQVSCLLANLCSLVLDYTARQKVGGLHLKYNVMKQLPILPPQHYNSEDYNFIAPRVLELVYTSNDLKSFAEDMGYTGAPFKWDEERRAVIRAELDAYYVRLYRLNRDDLRYILDAQDVYGEDFPGETFKALKDKDMRLYGEYRTQRLVLEAWDRLFGGGKA